MSTLHRRELRAYLNGLSRQQLVEQITSLCSAVPQAADYYQAMLRPETGDAVAEKYKRAVIAEFGRGYHSRPRLSIARKAVIDFEKIAGSTPAVADVMLTYVEAGMAPIADVGGLDEGYASSLSGMYERALKWICKHELQEQFGDRCKQIMTRGQQFGWGLGDALLESYGDHLVAEDEDEAPDEE